ncbi:hybrid sensor histidine kinase/response regulator transcription factor [Marinilabilia rubra]|uniref:histidine kinase n=1 Tax=Marinilabilia rubra TaxID=2162893 RepID=A0A2U2B9V1_9BACT|nr:substrate-binding domain-containing protein [Marinilabilia rubra]PWD99822.1 histidine kinase [Marinilabilia rubra]
MKQSLSKYPFLFLLIILFSGCKKNNQETFHIGFSQCAMDEWRETMNKEMVMTAALYPDLELTILNARENTRRQQLQIRELINNKVDLLIISPNESGPITPIAEEAFEQGIPTIIIDRKINSGKYTAFIGANNYQIGRDVATYIANIHNGKGRILEIRGMDGSSPARERHNGFFDVLKDHPNLNVVASMEGKWLPDNAREVAEEVFSEEQVDIVFGHNDVMARSAREVANSMGIEDLFVVGIDALPNLGMKLVEEGVLQASFIYPTGGKKAIEIARAILIDEPFNKQNILGTSVVDSTNVTVLRLQLEQVIAFQDILVKQTSRIRQQEQQFNDQRSLLNIALISLALLVILSLWLAYYYTMIRRRNSQLAHKNKAIEKQKEQLEHQNEQIREMNKQVERATQAKLSFFTNISHEIRTPLTLIQAPVNELISTLSSSESSLSTSLKESLNLIKQNTDRLLRLINQLMDFRKMDTGKINLNISETHLHEITENIYKAFLPLARQKEIDFKLESSPEEEVVWIDIDKIDKVIFNLLSNAFKFTPRKGEITLSTFINAEDQIIIEVSDSGPGIPPDKQQEIYEPFYQQKHHRSMGTGIGLALSKGFVEKHDGSIEVASDGKSGTLFRVTLPRGEKYKGAQDLVKQMPEIPQPQKKEFEENVQEKEWKDFDRKPRLLIVEDDEQLKTYLIKLLNQNYEVKSAANGKEALVVIEQQPPELILTDLMMPEMDGIELTDHLKQTIETSHIPIIMLTAKAGIDQKIHGIETGADAYIEKPFDPNYLSVRVRKLIETRRKLKIQYQSNIAAIGKSENMDNVTTVDQKFLSNLQKILEKNYTNPEFSVEDLSREIGMLRIHLYRKMKALTDFTPSEYIGKFRLHKAKYILEQQRGNISGVALDVGFTSPAYFSKKFREEFGKTPSAFIGNH